MRIAYVYADVPELHKGGPGVHIQESVRALRGLGHDVELFGGAAAEAASGASLAPRRRSALRKLVARFGYEPRALLRSLRTTPQAEAQLRRFQPDAVLARYEAFEIAPLLAARRLGVPLVWEVNGTSREIGWFNPDLFLYPGTLALERATLHGGAGIFVVSAELRTSLGDDGIDLRRVAVIPNGADPERFLPLTPDSPLPFERISGEVVIGFLGSFSRWHDVVTMALALARVMERHPEVRVVLAGTRWDDMPAAVRSALAPHRARLVLPGPVPISDAPRWMASFDIALSLYPQLDPFYFSPVKLFEYMASGVAVVATSVGQQAVVIRDGENGCLVPIGEVETIADRMSGLIVDPQLRQRLGRAARATVVGGYTWMHNAARVAALCAAAVRIHRVGERVVDVATAPECVATL